MLVLALLLAVGVPGGMARAGDVTGDVTGDDSGNTDTGKHVHDWNYEKINETIKATCNDNRNCTVNGGSVEISLKLTVDETGTETIYVGQIYEINVENIDKLELAEEERPTVQYYKGNELLKEKPEATEINEGTYTAKITLGSATIEKSFNIKKHNHKWNYTLDNTEKIIVATCDEEKGECENKTVNISLKLTVDETGTETIYVGQIYEINVENIDKLELAEEERPTVQYYKGNELLKEKPEATEINEGTYTAKITLGGVTIEKKFEIVIKKYPMQCEHTNITIKNQKESTCISEGYEGDKWCKDCEKVVSTGKTIEKNPQNHVGGTRIVNAKSATCTVKGYTGDIVCASCGAQGERGSEIPAKGYKWNKGKAAKKSTDKSEGVFTYTCTNGCRHTKTEIIPRKSITVDLGKKAKIISKASGCKMALTNASKYKKYLTFNAKTGEIKTKKYYKVKINKSIPIKIKIGGKNYTVKVKIKIPAPKTKEFKISKKNGKDSFGKFCRYTFKYNIKGASKIQVRVVNAKKTGKEKAINKILDRCVKKSKSNKSSYIEFSDGIMKKLKNKNNKVTFKIVVYYGKNQSETLTITK